MRFITNKIHITDYAPPKVFSMVYLISPFTNILPLQNFPIYAICLARVGNREKENYIGHNIILRGKVGGL